MPLAIKQTVDLLHTADLDKFNKIFIRS